MRYLVLVCVCFFAFGLSAQTVFKDGIPADLKDHKIIFLKHDAIEVTANKKGNRAEKYLYLRQSNHNKVISEANNKLVVAALQYPFQYAFATYKTYKKLAGAGYKYVFISSLYNYDHLKTDPKEGELIVFEYYLLDIQDNIAYKVFELDEMKVYDSKMVMKKFNKAIKEKFPEAY